mgnify:CR=1 FL=1
MFNEDQKLRYLRNCNYAETTIETIKIIFKATSRVEEYYNKDLCEFTQAEVNDLLKSMGNKSRAYLKGVCVYLENYYNWCLSEGLISDVINKYNPVFVTNIINEIVPKELLYNKYFSKAKLLEYINNIADITNKFITYALYYGISIEELVHIKMDDLDINNKILYLSKTNRNIKVDDMFVKIMQDANKAEFYNEDGSMIALDKIGLYGYRESEYVLKHMNRTQIDNQPLTKAMIAKRLSTIKEQSGNEFLTAPTLYKNGLINYIIEKFKEDKGIINLETILFDKINGKLYTYDEDTQKYIEEFGSQITVRMLRRELKDYIDCFK